MAPSSSGASWHRRAPSGILLLLPLDPGPNPWPLTVQTGGLGYFHYLVVDADGAPKPGVSVTYRIDGQTATSSPSGAEGRVALPVDTTSFAPETTALLPNFSNPFNPDTWIPYQLHEDAHITSRIYGAAGRVLRTLDLGYRAAGVYGTPERAACWDSRNEIGESVSSGVYCAEMAAGDYRKVRRIVLIK